MKKETSKVKIKEITASFSLKKSLGNYEMADIFFSANAEVPAKEKPEDVAEKIHQFCKTLAVQKYNSFSRIDLQAPQTPQEYATTSKNVKKIEMYKAKPTDPWRKGIMEEPTYIATERYPDGTSNKVKVTKEMIEQNEKETIIH